MRAFAQNYTDLEFVQALPAQITWYHNTTLLDKVSFICDIYDFDKYPNNFYNKNNKFDTKKITPL